MPVAGCLRSGAYSPTHDFYIDGQANPILRCADDGVAMSGRQEACAHAGDAAYGMAAGMA